MFMTFFKAALCCFLTNKQRLCLHPVLLSEIHRVCPRAQTNIVITMHSETLIVFTSVFTCRLLICCLSRHIVVHCVHWVAYMHDKQNKAAL